MLEALKILEEKVGTGEIIKIKYHGGSQPGAIREIVPTKISGDKVIAYCHSSKTAGKSFIISKIEIIDYKKAEEPSEIMYGNYQPPTLAELHTKHKEEWEKLGWHIEMEEQFIGLYKKYKNGKVLKYPTVFIEYSNEIMTGIVFDPDMQEENEIYTETQNIEILDSKRYIPSEEYEHTYAEVQDAKRPWVVSGHKGKSRFANYQKAIDKFLEFAKVGPVK